MSHKDFERFYLERSRLAKDVAVPSKPLACAIWIVRREGRWHAMSALPIAVAFWATFDVSLGETVPKAHSNRSVNLIEGLFVLEENAGSLTR